MVSPPFGWTPPMPSDWTSSLMPPTDVQPAISSKTPQLLSPTCWFSNPPLMRRLSPTATPFDCRAENFRTIVLKRDPIADIGFVSLSLSPSPSSTVSVTRTALSGSDCRNDRRYCRRRHRSLRRCRSDRHAGSRHTERPSECRSRHSRESQRPPGRSHQAHCRQRRSGRREGSGSRHFKQRQLPCLRSCSEPVSLRRSASPRCRPYRRLSRHRRRSCR